MSNKRPKITVTESNREFVIPTLEKLGGVNQLEIEITDTKLNSVFFINAFNNIDYWGVEFFNRNINDDNYYEVDPKDYVGVKSEPSELDQLKAENEKLRECLKLGYECVKHWTKFEKGEADVMDREFLTKSEQLIK